MSKKEHGSRSFGDGRLIGDNNEEYFGQGLREKARDLGYSHGCPIAIELTDPDNLQLGPEKMLKRYGETNFWFGYILDLTKKKNPELYEKLSNPVLRKSGEPVGYFEPESVPESHSAEIAPMTRIYGYAIPRILIEIFGRGENRNNETLISNLEVLDEMISDIRDPQQLLAELVDIAYFLNLDPNVILGHVLPAGVLREENCISDFSDIIDSLSSYAPDVYEYFRQLSTDEKVRLGIADL